LPLMTDLRGRRARRRLAVLPVFLLTCACLLAGREAAAAAGGKRWERLPARRFTREQVEATTGGRRLLDAELRRQAETDRRWHAVHELLGPRQVSAKSQRLLAERGLGPARLRPDVDADKAWAGVDTLRVLFVRIDFDGNRAPNLTTVPAGGGFRLDPLADPGPLEVDPPPHDKAYFESHLQGLTEYYRFMSGRRLHIEGRVLPEGDQAAYHVRDIADYGPGEGGFWTITGLESLVRDMITATDQGTQADGSVNLADYDDNDPFTYVIFVHSGSDWQSDINGDSPNDVPTFFVNLGDAQALTSIGGDGEPGALTECSVIPETTNQDGLAGSIAAAFYHEFGHALGLPDVYDTSRGLTAVGIWDLMDSGTNLAATLGTITDQGDTVFVVASGVLPPSLAAWDKWYLGWLETDEVDGSRPTCRLPAVGIPRGDYADADSLWGYGYGPLSTADPQAWRIGLSPREWFLVENRWVPMPGEPMPFDSLAFERDDATGVILYMAGLVSGTDQWQNSGLYDYYLPAGGVLVWHVNEDRIEAGLAGNTINTDADGLKLVEADGLQDIGILNNYYLGWYGSWRDPFGGYDLDGNETGFTELPADGFPNTRLFDRSWSHVSLADIGPATGTTASVMKFSPSLGRVPTGLPWEAVPEGAGVGVAAGPRALDPVSLVPLTVAGLRLLLFTDAPGGNHGDAPFDATLYALSASGRAFFAHPSELPPAGIAALGGLPAGPPLVLGAESSQSDVVFALREGTLRCVRVGDQGVSTPWTATVADTLTGGPSPLRDAAGITRLALLAPPASLYLRDAAGNALGAPIVLTDGQGAAVNATGHWTVTAPDGTADRLCVVSAGGWHLAGAGDAGWTGTPLWTPYARASRGTIRAGLVPADGAVLVHLFDDDGPLGSWRVEDGAVTALAALPAVTGALVCDPAVADLDGDGANDLVVATGDRVHALKAAGIPLRGWPRPLRDLFPLADTTRVAGPLVVADATGDGQNEVVFDTDGGHLFMLGPDGVPLPQLPLRWGDRAAAGFAVADGGAERLLWLVSAGGYTSPPLDRTWINGRVAGWRLAAAAPEGTPTTSEWRGPGGGPDRRGPVGTANDLGDASPAAADRAEVILFPNPLSGEAVNVRFWADGAAPARLAVYDLQGELVREGRFAVTAGQMNQVRLDLPGLASGMYVAVLQYDATGGRRTRTMTLAVEK
jgi:M6 family metalloprotease-like protein